MKKILSSVMFLLVVTVLIGCSSAKMTPVIADLKTNMPSINTSVPTLVPTVAPTTAPTTVPTKNPTAAPKKETSTEAPVTKAKAPTQEPIVEQTVYITNTGEKYHRSSCRYLSKSKIAISLSKAKSGGYSACSVCKPPR